jgi:hypothetical protein
MAACGRPKINVVDEVLDRRLVERGQTIYLDNGSTFVYLAMRILERASSLAPLRVVTGNSVIQLLWMIHPSARLISLECIGGDYVPDHSCTGGPGEAWLSSTRFVPDIDVAFLGVSRLDPGTGLYARISDVLEVKRLAIERARRVAVLLDETKVASGSQRDELVGHLEIRAADLCVSPVDRREVVRPVTMFVGMCTEVTKGETERRDALARLLPEGMGLEVSVRNNRVLVLARETAESRERGGGP